MDEKREPVTKQNLFRRYSVPTFIGCNDVELNTLKLNSLGPCGRDSEKAQLREAFRRVHKARDSVNFNEKKIERRCSLTSAGGENAACSPELVLIAGRSGTGKSTLAESIEGDVKHEGGFFVSGKFHMITNSEPYTAFLSAFDSLCDHIISAKNSSDDSVDRASAFRIQSAISDAIGSESTFLKGIIPKLSLLLGTHENVNKRQTAHKEIDEGFMMSQNRFNCLLRQFIRSYCSQKTLVMFLDDLQWADKASLQLIETLVSDRNNPNFLIIGSYRDDEIQEGGNASFPTFIENVCALSTTTVTSIQLNNLDIDTTNMIISHSLTSTIEKTLSLAEIVHKKTYGNPFAIIHFLKNMQDEGFLQYNTGLLSWTWEEDNIRTCMSATDNVVKMLVYKIKKKLPTDVRRVLQIAACLGVTFDSSTVTLVTEKIHCLDQQYKIHEDSNVGNKCLDAVQCLDLCVNEGLLDTDGALEYHFVHDQVLAASFSLIPEDRCDILQFQIGEALMENLPSSELEKNIFVVVGLLNHGGEIATVNKKKSAHLSRLNLQAATKALNLSAFGSGATYIETGIRLLGNNHWIEQKSLSLALYNVGAKIEYCNGNLDRMQDYIDAVFSQNLPIKEKVDAYSTQIFNLGFLQDKSDDALALAISVLAQLGVNFPRNTNKVSLVKSFLKTKRLLRGINASKLCNLPIMVNETKLLAMQLLSQMQENSFFSKPELFPFITMKMVRMSVRHGISKFTAFAVGCCGVLLSSMDRIQEANSFADAAIAMVDKFKARDMEPKVFLICYNLISFRKHPFFLIHKYHLESYETGLQIGDVNFALFHLRSACVSALIAGKPLQLLDSQIRETIKETEEYKQKKNMDFLRPLWQFVLNMMGRSSDPVILTGDAIQKEEYVQIRRGNVNGSFTVQLVRTFEYWAAFYFGDLELVLTLQKEMKIAGARRSTPLFLRTTLFEGLSAFSLARTKNSQKWKRRGAKILSKTRQWVNEGDINFKHVLLMFEAEVAILKRKHEKAREKYKEAISVCSRYGYSHDRALANERFGEYLLGIGDFLASDHILMACRTYMKWGAVAKAKQIQEKHAKLFTGIDVNKLDERWSV